MGPRFGYSAYFEAHLKVSCRVCPSLYDVVLGKTNGLAQLQTYPLTSLAIKEKFCDKLRFDNQEPGFRQVQWLYHDTEFLFTYTEVPDVVGTAIWRARHQPATVGSIPDNWMDLDSLRALDNLLRSAKKRKGHSASGLKVIKGSEIHEGASPDNIILQGFSGSHAYGLNHDGLIDVEGNPIKPSDVDLRGVFVVPTKEVLALGKHKELVEQKDIDSKWDEVERFLSLCLKSNPERLEMLGYPQREIITPAGQTIVDNQKIFLSRRVIKTYGGYTKGQLGRIETKKDRSTKPILLPEF